HLLGVTSWRSVAGSNPRSCSSGATAMSNAPPEQRCKSCAIASTSKVHGSTAIAPALASRLRRDTSLPGSWKLISRCTRATAANAASTAVAISVDSAPDAAISTKAPSSGRARLRLSCADCIGGQNLLHAFGDVERRERGARYVADVLADLERAAAPFSD